MAGDWIGLVSSCISVCTFAFASHTFVKKNPGLRRKIVANPLWKLQFVGHPWIIGGLVAATGVSRFAEHLSSDGGAFCSPWWWALATVPFAFNFAVEPYDLPADPVFLLFFYTHHAAPVVASSLLAAAKVGTNHRDRLIAAVWAQGLVFGHAWLLHTIGYFDHKKQIDKQLLFWPYMALGFLIQVNWWRSLLFVEKIPELRTNLMFDLGLPTLLQYTGRWGLYLRLCALTRCHRGKDRDAFEWNKQFVEAGTFVASFNVARFIA